jgi:hypothetical protein
MLMLDGVSAPTGMVVFTTMAIVLVVVQPELVLVPTTVSNPALLLVKLTVCDEFGGMVVDVQVYAKPPLLAEMVNTGTAHVMDWVVAEGVIE